MTAKKSILVPTDFTEVAWFALQHAIRVSEVVKEPIHILHCVSESEKLAKAESKMASLIESV
ncbi:MAG: universal stress protein, partial [Bacteroidales bacterium]|nr:universal stress protein [Bacteroidales bacterium]